MSTDFHDLQIQKLVKETDNATSVYFTIPEEHKDTFQYKAGQYLTLKFDINGKEERRAYSICTSPLSNEIAVTSKRVDKGLVSNHMNDHLSEGQVVSVMPPQGKFTVALDGDQMNDYYLFAGGSGVTPMMSLIQTILEKEPKSSIHLYYGNTDENNIIFRTELAELEQKYAGQFNVRHILSDPIKEKAGGLGGLFKKAKTNWKGWSGFPDRQNIATFLEENPKTAKQQKYLICGPTKMMDVVKLGLEGIGIDASDIMIEYFSSPKDENAAVSAGSGGTQTIKVNLKGETFDALIPADKTILDALLEMKKDAPFSCTSGACSTCVAKVKSGKVSMEVCYALDDDEVASGYILACQAHPESSDVEIVFDE